jgi:heterodisulfide reductase subunit B2
MKLSFYPGCSLDGMANDYARSIAAVFQRLEIELVELDDWSCCGATAAHSLDEALAAALPARNLALAEKLGLELVSPCANCYNRLRFSQKRIKEKLVDVPWEVTGDLRVHDMTRFLAQPEIIQQIEQRVIRPLTGLRVVCYYGCQMVRPPRITGFADFHDFENPQTLDRIATTLGAQVQDWSYKGTCCGASIGIGRKDIQDTLTARLLVKAGQAGAEAIVVSCPLCQANLDIIQRRSREKILPVFYFTELLRLAFEGGEKAGDWFKMHFADPLPLLHGKGLLRL